MEFFTHAVIYFWSIQHQEFSLFKLDKPQNKVHIEKKYTNDYVILSCVGHPNTNEKLFVTVLLQC